MPCHSSLFITHKNLRLELHSSQPPASSPSDQSRQAFDLRWSYFSTPSAQVSVDHRVCSVEVRAALRCGCGRAQQDRSDASDEGAWPVFSAAFEGSQQKQPALCPALIVPMTCYIRMFLTEIQKLLDLKVNVNATFETYIDSSSEPCSIIFSARVGGHNPRRRH